MLQVLSIIGQTILILIGMGLVFSLILFNLAGVRALRKLGQELRDSNLPESDLIIPKPFDRQPATQRRSHRDRKQQSSAAG